MAIGLVVQLASNAHRQLLVASGASNYPALRVLNPNDGVVYAARNRDVTDLNITSWDWKIPSQSYAAVPGPFQTIGLYYTDQSGSGRGGEVTVYASQQKLDDPMFVAIGRAVQVSGTAMDITEGPLPANPPAGSSRLWVDVDGVLHILDDTGDSDTFITDETALGGALVGFLPNPSLASNTVGAAQIINGSIGTAEMGNQVVTQAILAKPSVGAPELIAGAAASNIGTLSGALSGTLPQPSLSYQQSVLGAAVALPTAAYTPILNLALPAGVWMVSAGGQFITSTAGQGWEIRVTDGVLVRASAGLTMAASNQHAHLVIPNFYYVAATPITIRLDAYSAAAGTSVYHISPFTGQPGATNIFALRLG